MGDNVDAETADAGLGCDEGIHLLTCSAEGDEGGEGSVPSAEGQALSAEGAGGYREPALDDETKERIGRNSLVKRKRGIFFMRSARRRGPFRLRARRAPRRLLG